MADGMFQIVYCGDIAAGHDVETVKTNLGKLTGYSFQRIESLFTGRKVVIKSGIDQETAERYMAALARTGAVCYCLPLSVTPAAPPPEPSVPDLAESEMVCAESGTFLALLSSGPSLFRIIMALAGLVLFLYLLPEIRKKADAITGSTEATPQAATVATSRLLSVFAGSPGQRGLADGEGSAARFGSPAGMASDGRNLYVSDLYYRNIRAISLSTGTVRTLAGSTEVKGSSGIVDGQGGAARFNQLDFLATDGSYLYVLDGDLLRKIDVNTGNVTSVPTALATTDPLKADPAAERELRIVNGIATDGRYLYALGNASVRKIDIFTGETAILAGSCHRNAASDGVGTAAVFRWPTGITTDGTYLYVLDDGAIRKITTATGEVSTVKTRRASGRYLATDGKVLYVSSGFSQGRSSISVFDLAGGDEVKGAGSNEKFDAPAGIAIEAGKLYVGERKRNTVSAMATSAFTGTR
jgi:hypothetical protein